MVSATGDWTKNTMASEYPAVRRIYKLFDAEAKLTAIQIDAAHNYNQPSREAVYGWFAHWFLGRAEATPLKERGAAVAPINDLLVFFGRTRPKNELNESQLTESLIKARKRQLDEARPRDAAGLEEFREQFGEAFRYSLMAEFPASKDILAGESQTLHFLGKEMESLFISRRDKSDSVNIILRKSSAKSSGSSIVILAILGDAFALNHQLIDLLNEAGHDVALVRCFPGGRQIPEKIKFFTTYNRTDVANRAQDILTAIAYLKGRNPKARLNVVGLGEAGLWALLARGVAPAIDRMVVDAAQFDSSSDEAFIKIAAVPGIRRAGDFTTAVTIAPLTPLLVHNTGNKFNTGKIEAVYKVFGKADDFKTQSAKLSDSELAAWLSSK
jgi:hypothetical protein